MKTTLYLHGVHRGEKMFLGTYQEKEQWVTLWDTMLILERRKLPHPLIYRWRGRYVAGGRFWREIPHPMVKNPLNTILYEDTLMSFITKPIRDRIRDDTYRWLALFDRIRSKWRESGI